MQQGDSNNDPLLFNKIAGAGLTALLIIFGLPQLTAAIFGGGAHHGAEADELHLAYGGDLELEMSAGPVEEAPAKSLATLLNEASVSAGERRTGVCKSCHTLEEGGANGAGPNLWGIIGRPVASHEGFNYSSALRDFGGDWTYERLDQFLKNSQEYVPGTAMVQRFAKDEQRADMLVYLRTLSSDPVPLPEAPAAPAAEEEAASDDAAHGEVE